MSSSFAPSSSLPPQSPGPNAPANLPLTSNPAFHVGFITPPFRDSKIPVTDHLHVHAYIGTLDRAGWWRAVAYSSVAWYSIEDLIAEIRFVFSLCQSFLSLFSHAILIALVGSKLPTTGCDQTTPSARTLDQLTKFLTPGPVLDCRTAENSVIVGWLPTSLKLPRREHPSPSVLARRIGWALLDATAIFR